MILILNKVYFDNKEIVRMFESAGVTVVEDKPAVRDGEHKHPTDT